MAGPVVADLEMEGVVEGALECFGQRCEREWHVWQIGSPRGAPCPGCGRLAAVRAARRSRHILVG